MPQPRKEDQARKMYALYLEGYSLSEVGQAWGKTRQSIYDVFKRRGWQLRERTFMPAVEFQGDSYAPDPRGYYRRTKGDRSLLHHAVWEHHVGPIPDGHEIHHRDGNKANNAITNLQCVTPAQHTAMHNPHRPIPLRFCLACGNRLVRKVRPDGQLERPAELARRLYCGPSCKGAHARGKPRKWGPRHEHQTEGA